MTTDAKAIELTVHCVKDGYPLEIFLCLPLAQIGPALDRLRSHGFQPLDPYQTMGKASIAPQNGAQKVAPAEGVAKPTKNSNGELCCPIHRRPLKEGRRGLFCSHKDKQTDVYCSFTWRSEDVAQ